MTLARLVKATPAQLDLAMAGLAFVAVCGVLLFLWLKWQEGRRTGGAPPARGKRAGPSRKRRRS